MAITSILKSTMEKYGLNHGATGGLVIGQTIPKDSNSRRPEPEGWFVYVISQGSFPDPDIFIRNIDDTQKAGISNL